MAGKNKTPDVPTVIKPAIEFDEPDWGTTFEVFDIDFKQKQIKIIIDGFSTEPDDSSNREDGFLLKIIPVMPGWMFRKGIIGSVRLTTRNPEKLKQSPEKYIIGFRLLKNAYKSDSEINEFFSSLLNKKSDKE
jgi:hypothetical protein